jgi:CO/xanthine dehydrogenase Mo-binding subunit
MNVVPENQAAERKEGDFQSAEVWDKVTGKTVYGIDLHLPGMLVGKILRSPHPHARIKSIDVSGVRQMPGVRAVITGAELTQKPYGIIFNDELPLAVDTVRYIGDEVAAVAAVDEAAARRAVEAIRVEYEELPAVFEPEVALQPGAPQLHGDFPGNLAWERLLERGDVEKGFEEADVVVEETFTTQTIHHAYLEPISCVAAYDPYFGLTLHTALQSPHIVGNLVAEVLGLARSRVRVAGPAMGGGFGGKVYGNLKVYLLSALLAMHADAPVKIKLTREEEFIAGRPMVPVVFKVKMGLRADGTITARESDILVDNGAYSAQAPWVSKTLSERNDSLYRIPNIRTRTRLAYTNKVPTGQVRAYGNQTGNFAYESLLDLAARKLGIDPLEIRLKNCIGPGDISVHGLQIKSCNLAECFKTAAAAVGWKDKKPGRGYGISGAIHANGSVVAHNDFRGAAAVARLEEDGRISVFTGEQDYGQGMHAVFAQIVARVLGLAPGDITVYSRDTAVTPYSQGAFAMRQTTVGGNAVRLAAEDLRRKMIEIASEILDADAEPAEGALRTAAGARLSFSEIAVHARCRRNGLSLTGEGNYELPVSSFDSSGYGNISVTYSFAAHAAEVEVDPQTGALTVHRIVAVQDSGRILNHTASRGQVYGGVTQGLGYSFFEGYLFDGGRVLNPDLANYQLPTSLDVPLIEPVFIETDDPEGPFGAKGLGEIVMVPVLGALANAVADAAGAPVTALPMTPEKIFRAVSGKECRE